ncbi:OLC1v1016343C1 [Oldenlandia corymbosa var. corymbosa]|uniref:OLC1v1016343C1 n=1 Tax=Oldenlandia corymbosa var. corymbosa TaxID=529605 RepID=A0AAV1E6W5_OLDCO|nr:OLC1v1016343C1 [Oldenlandia corymbosa var. corymbosa]
MDSAMERGARKVVMEIEAAWRKNEDIKPIPIREGRSFGLAPSARRNLSRRARDSRSLGNVRNSLDQPAVARPSLRSDNLSPVCGSRRRFGRSGRRQEPRTAVGSRESVGRGLGNIQGLELHEARRAVIEAKAENDRLDKLWRETEAYWEDHLKNSIQLEILAENRLRTFEAKIRKKKDEGLSEPDPEDFIPRNYFESVLVHLRKVYALVAVKWDRSSDKIEALRAYAGQLQAALESAISFIVEMGKEYDFEALWPEPCPAMRDDPTSPTREAERMIYENDALFHELGRGSY